MEYYLKDLGHGFGTFIKITDWSEIKNNFLLNIGDNYIVFTLGLEEDMIINEHTSNNENEEYNNLINLKIFSGNIRHGKLSFIDDSMLSRFHCTLKFIDSKWYIIDGTIDKNKNKVKPSTNGSWKYAFEETLITNGMTFKANHNLFICSFSN